MVPPVRSMASVMDLINVRLLTKALLLRPRGLGVILDLSADIMAYFRSSVIKHH